jgi:DNA-binding MarR family transcriptional regulator
MSRRLFELILAIKRRCQSNEERIRNELGLSPAELNALIVLDDDLEVTGCVFAERMALSPSRGSRVLSQLVAHGYVKTHVCPEDRRTIRIAATSRGKRMRRRIIERMNACEDRIRGSLNQADVGRLTQALELLETVLYLSAA